VREREGEGDSNNSTISLQLGPLTCYFLCSFNEVWFKQYAKYYTGNETKSFLADWIK
jgi:hypothetical protein